MRERLSPTRCSVALAAVVFSFGCGGDGTSSVRSVAAIGSLDGPVADILRSEYVVSSSASVSSGDERVVVLDGDHTSAAAIRAMVDLKGAVDGGKAVIIVDAQQEHEEALSDVVEFPVLDSGEAHAYGVAKDGDQYLQFILPKLQNQVASQKIEYADGEYTFGPTSNGSESPPAAVSSIKAFLRDVANRRSLGDPFVPPPKAVKYFFNVTAIYEDDPANKALNGQELDKAGYRIDLGVLSEDSPGVFRQYLMNVFDLEYQNMLLTQVAGQPDPWMVGWMQTTQTFEGSFHNETDRHEPIQPIAQSNLVGTDDKASSVAAIIAGYRDASGALQQWKFDTGGWTNNPSWTIGATVNSGVKFVAYQKDPYDAMRKNYADFWLNGHMRPKLPDSVWHTHFFLAPTFRFEKTLRGKVGMNWTLSREYDRITIHRDQGGNVTADHVVIDSSVRPTTYNFAAIYHL
ncbi:MAG: hypothetical protein ACAH95_12050 [Fimbriimonas sp.]